MKRVVLNMVVMLLLVLGLVGCQKEEVKGKYQYKVYYLDRSETKVDFYEYYTDTEDMETLLAELTEQMVTVPKDVNHHETVHNFGITGTEVKENRLIVTVDEAYKKLSPTTEVLTRAALVRTFTQIEGIDFVSMKVNEEDLTDSLGGIVGIMDAGQFVDNTGSEINAYENTELILYFASEDGKQLIRAKRPVIYNSNISMEKLVVEQLIGGPVSKDVYPTLSKNTKIVGVTLKDRICYVNLNEGFLEQMSNVSPEVTVYSLVNSLTELNSVDKVQIFINGKTDVTFRETYSLNTLFEKNEDVIK